MTKSSEQGSSVSVRVGATVADRDAAALAEEGF
jgi:hypothetical protein